jgi:glycosyltransferase involved in cell wall biosynthesis
MMNHPVTDTRYDPSLVLDVIIPVYNEEKVLEQSVMTLAAKLAAEAPSPWRITIADNASTDRTLDIARRLAADSDGRVSVVHLEEKGRGRALRQAWASSGAAVVAYTDVDLSTNLDHLMPLVQPLIAGEFHVATGSRLMKASRVTRQWKREVISRGYNGLVKAFFPRRRFVDAQCGFKAITRRAADELLPMVEDQAWFFDTELLLRAEQRGYSVWEVPVEWIEDLDSRVRIVRTAVDDVKGLWRVRRHPLPRVQSPVTSSPASDGSSAIA